MDETYTLNSRGVRYDLQNVIKQRDDEVWLIIVWFGLEDGMVIDQAVDTPECHQMRCSMDMKRYGASDSFPRSHITQVDSEDRINCLSGTMTPESEDSGPYVVKIHIPPSSPMRSSNNWNCGEYTIWSTLFDAVRVKISDEASRLRMLWLLGIECRILGASDNEKTSCLVEHHLIARIFST